MLVALAPFGWQLGGSIAALSAAVVFAVATGSLGLAFPALQRSKPIALAAYVVMVNAACAVATFNALRGHRVSHWDPARSVDEVSGPAA